MLPLALLMVIITDILVLALAARNLYLFQHMTAQG